MDDLCGLRPLEVAGAAACSHLLFERISQAVRALVGASVCETFDSQTGVVPFEGKLTSACLDL